MKTKEQIWGLLGNICLAGESRQDLMRLARDKSIKNIVNRMNQLSPHLQSNLVISFQHLFSDQCSQSLNVLFKVNSPQPLGQKHKVKIQFQDCLLWTVAIPDAIFNWQCSTPGGGGLSILSWMEHIKITWPISRRLLKKAGTSWLVRKKQKVHPDSHKAIFIYQKITFPLTQNVLSITHVLGHNTCSPQGFLESHNDFHLGSLWLTGTKVSIKSSHLKYSFQPLYQQTLCSVGHPSWIIKT